MDDETDQQWNADAKGRAQRESDFRTHRESGLSAPDHAGPCERRSSGSSFEQVVSKLDGCGTSATQKEAGKKDGHSYSGEESREPNLWQRHQRDLSIVALFVVGLFVALADFHALGPVGQTSRADSPTPWAKGVTPLPSSSCLGVVLVSGKVEFDQARATWGGVFALVAVSGIADLTGGRPGIHATTTRSGMPGAGSASGLGERSPVGLASPERRSFCLPSSSSPSSW